MSAGPRSRIDKEVESYRNLMLPPSTYEDGFRFSSLLGALFVALLMVPGAMYMQLVAGFGVGPAAQWVTVILFIEVARRAHRNLTKPELYVLFYMAGAVMQVPFKGLLVRQFFVQSQAAHAAGVADKIPFWWAPTDPNILAERSFMMVEWLPAVALVAMGTIISRLNTAILGYGLFRVASDVERLPFPMATIGASGLMALAEQSQEEKASEEGSWRWRVFSVGGMLGLTFGVIYMGLPLISGALLEKPIQIFPIPFSDWTKKTQDLFPAVAVGINWNMTQLVMGMVLPFFAMLGSFIGFLITLIANPILYKYNILHSWQTNDETVATIYKNNIDFYFSFTIGLSIAIAAMGLWNVFKGLVELGKKKKAGELVDPTLDEEAERERIKSRGDIKAPAVIGTYLLTTLAYIIVSGFLIDWHPGVMIVLLGLGFIYTPLISYVTARLEGLAGQVIQIPMIREFAFILSGYTGGVAVWFLPVPMNNYGIATVRFRQAELTGTKIISVWKAELILTPIIILATVFFANFIWSLAEIPSPRYPYAEVMWELQAANLCIIYSSTLGIYSPFEEALNGYYILSGTSIGLVAAGTLSLFKVPTMLFYGAIRGLNQTIPHVIIPQFVGACISRFYLQRKMGQKWRQYAPVVAAGFTCGMGLITVFCVGVTFLAKSVIHLPY
jgi:hypothetical protein